MKYFGFSTFFALLGFFGAFYIGGTSAAYIVLLLALLEISLSFDNAVINAKVLQQMDEKWQFRFIAFGIPIAVFGIRFLLPVLIVAIASGTGFIEVVNVAFNSPEEYKQMLQSVMTKIYAFGGAFLLMVFLEFYFDNTREIRWLKGIESNILVTHFSKINSIELIISILVGLIIVNATQDYSIAIAYFLGVFIYSLISSVDGMLSSDGVKSGIMGFLYLEVLDASFSLDGVIGAFALSTNIFIIMIGLAIGAFFVRSLTIYFVREKLLSYFRYLEHGAHYAIFVLASIMFLEIFTHVSEIITGSVGILIIIASIIHSIYHNKQDKKESL